GGVGDKNLHGHHAALAAYARQQRLTENAFQNERKLRANLRLLVRWKHVNNTVDGGSRRVSVQRSEGQVAGFSNAQRGFNGFKIAHFADQHHVWIFTQCGTESITERLGVRVDFALIDQTTLVLVHKLDGIFNGYDVVMALGVDLIEHGSERGGFA